MKNILFGCLMSMTFTLSLAQIKDGPDVVNLTKKKFKWMVERKVDSLGSALDERLKYIHSNGLTQSKADVLNDLISGKLTYQDIVVGDLDARIFNRSTAIVTGKARFSGVNNGTAFAVDLLFTEVYVLTHNAWLLASRHASKLP